VSTTKTIPGIQYGPDHDLEIHEPARVERVAKEVKHGRAVEANDPVVSAALSALEELVSTLHNEIDVQYQKASGMVGITVYSENGEKIVRRAAPEEAIRLVQNMKNARSNFVDNIL